MNTLLKHTVDQAQECPAATASWIHGRTCIITAQDYTFSKYWEEREKKEHGSTTHSMHGKSGHDRELECSEILDTCSLARPIALANLFLWLPFYHFCPGKTYLEPMLLWGPSSSSWRCQDSWRTLNTMGSGIWETEEIFEYLVQLEYEQFGDIL